jgi:hypothetical protein
MLSEQNAVLLDVAGGDTYYYYCFVKVKNAHSERHFLDWLQLTKNISLL